LTGGGRSYLESGEREEVFWEEVAEMELDFKQFVETISSSFMLVSKTFKGQLVIPQFQEFSRSVILQSLRRYPCRSGPNINPFHTQEHL
jgi:hypothetical protein